MYSFETLRNNMVECQLLPGHITDEKIINAMANTPREIFIPKRLQHIAYIDDPIAITEERYLMSPLTFALMLLASNITNEKTVLDIGCSCGYSTAVIAKLAKKVIAVEPDPDLASKTNLIINRLGIKNAIVINENPTRGHPDSAPYDVIFVNGTVDFIPQSLIEQLDNSGKIIYIQKKSPHTGIITVEDKKGQKQELDDVCGIKDLCLKEFSKKETQLSNFL